MARRSNSYGSIELRAVVEQKSVVLIPGGCHEEKN